eukprot:6190045-Amphidinium_carterae.1
MRVVLSMLWVRGRCIGYRTQLLFRPLHRIQHTRCCSRKERLKGESPCGPLLSCAREDSGSTKSFRIH